MSSAATLDPLPRRGRGAVGRVERSATRHFHRVVDVRRVTLRYTRPTVPKIPLPRCGRGAVYANAGSGTLAFLKAGMTSVAKRSSCSRQTAFGTPTDRLTEIRSSPG